jgi:hypothetical protein
LRQRRDWAALLVNHADVQLHEGGFSANDFVVLGRDRSRGEYD